MKVVETDLPGVLLLEPTVHADFRGFFLETWNEATFRRLGLDTHFVQDNHSRSSTGSLRGLHYQISRPQVRLVRVMSGSVFDVAVDLRRSSPTFGRWMGHELSANNKKMLWVPRGCAHGFYALSDTDVFYKCSDFYDPADERAIRWDDSELAIDWPVPDGRPLIVSARDRAGSSFRESETYA